MLVFDKASQINFREQGMPIRGDGGSCEAYIRTEMLVGIISSALFDKIDFNCVGVEEYEYTSCIEFGDETSQEKRKQLQQEGLLEDARRLTEALRPLKEEKKADIVVFFSSYPLLSGITGRLAENAWGIGKGYSMTDEKAFIQAADYHPDFAKNNFLIIIHPYALTVLRNSLSLPHEVCHLLGCGHSDTQIPAPGPFYYCDSCGIHFSHAGTTTLMGYPLRRPGDKIPHTRLGYLSGFRSNDILGKEKIAGGIFHNNQQTALRNAPLLSHYHLNGESELLNSTRETAIMMPPMVHHNTFLSALHPKSQSERNDNLTQFAKVFPGLLSRTDYFSTIYGTNVHSSKNDDADHNRVWYKLIPPEDGKCIIGVREFGTDENFIPILQVFDGNGRPVYYLDKDSKQFNGLHAVSVNAVAKKPLYIEVASGKPGGGNFSLYARLKPGLCVVSVSEVNEQREHEKLVYAAKFSVSLALVLLSLSYILTKKSRLREKPFLVKSGDKLVIKVYSEWDRNAIVQRTIVLQRAGILVTIGNVRGAEVRLNMVPKGIKLLSVLSLGMPSGYSQLSLIIGKCRHLDESRGISYMDGRIVMQQRIASLVIDGVRIIMRIEQS